MSKLIAKCIENKENDYYNIEYYSRGGVYANSIGESVINELKIGKEYEVEYIQMGVRHAAIYLKEFPNKSFNSMLFKFYKDGKLHDIYHDKKYKHIL